MSLANVPSVLLVDDAHDMLEMLRRSMNAMGLTPFTANNVVDAIELVEHGPVHLVITDLNMPEVSGIQLVRYLGEHFPEIPVLVITGYPKLEDAVHVMKLGAVEYLVKPFTQQELRDAVQSCVEDDALRVLIITGTGRVVIVGDRNGAPRIVVEGSTDNYDLGTITGGGAALLDVAFGTTMVRCH